MEGRLRFVSAVVVPCILAMTPGRLAAQVPADTVPEAAIVELRLGRLAARTVQAYRVGTDALVPLSQFLELAEIFLEPGQLGTHRGRRQLAQYG